MLKQDAINTINALPENASMEDIMYCLYILDKHIKALGDIDAGRVHSTGDIRKSIVKNQ